MAGLKLHVCFWYIDESLIDQIIEKLVEGNYDPIYCRCRDTEALEERLLKGNIDLIISDFDLPDALRNTIEGIHSRIAFHIPLIYIVGERNESKAAETLKRGVWDYILKTQFVKLVPTIYSSQKYGKVLKHSKKVEDELEESESKYRSIFNTVKDAILLIEADTFQILDFNQSVMDLFGFDHSLTKEEVIAGISEFTQSYCTHDLGEVAESLGEQKSVSFLCLNKHTDGSEFWTENTLTKLDHGNNFQYILVIRNIQEQKLMEESLQKSREHFRNLAENSPDVIMRFDKSYRHLYVNQPVLEQTGIPANEFINKTHEEMGIFQPEMIEFWERSIEKVFQSGENNTVEFDLINETKIVTFEWRLFPEFDEAGKTQTVLAIARNITEAKQAREAISRSEERLKLAVEATSLGYWDWNIENDEVFYSPIYFRMLGYEEADFTNKVGAWEKLLHEDDREKSQAVVEDCLTKKIDSFEMEFRLLCKDGSYKWICGRGRVAEFAEDGRARRLIGTHEDISARKRNDLIQETLVNISNAVNTTKNLDELYEKIREFLGSIVDTTNCFLAIYHEETNMLTLPFHRDEVDSFNEFPAGKTLTGYVVMTGKSQLIDAERELQLTREGYIEPVGAPCVSWLGVPLKTDNKIIGVFVVQSYKEEVIYTKEDVTILEFVSDQIALAIERKQDQDNVRESQERQRRIFESSPDPIIVVDPNGIVIDYNTNLLTALYITNEPIIGQNIFHFISRKFWRSAIENFQRTWEEGYIKNLEFVVHRADGSFFDSEVSTGAIYNNHGEPDSMVIIFKDISERKETERNLREAKEKAEESDRLKTAFLSNMSHEIRTPMNAIVGFSDLLNNENLSPKDRSEFIAQINMGADNLMHLIDDIIDISKIEAGQIKINRQETYLHDLLKEQIVMFRQNIDRLDKSDVELRLHWGLKEEQIVIDSDPFRVKQIITNLLNNAIKFTEEGFVELGVVPFGRFLKLYVKDSGIGIEDEKQDVIFDRFMQGHKSKTKLYGGTGLGLAISKNLVELLGGEIGVISTAGAGSEFWFTLPLELIDAPLAETISQKKEINKDWSGKKILVAEDDNSNFQLLLEALKPTRAEIIRAKDGKEAIRLFEEHLQSLHLVLMDIQMPEMNGYDCTRIMKESRPDLPVIAQTAYAMSGEEQSSLDAGCDDYIKKPLQVMNLIETLGVYLK